MPFHLNQTRLEYWLLFQYFVGFSFIFSSKILKRWLAAPGNKSRLKKAHVKDTLQHLRVELSRKSFHIIGGTTIVAVYHYGLRFGVFSSAWQLESREHGEPLNFAVFFAPWSVAIWTIEFLRMVFPPVNNFIFSMMGSVVREKETASATGMSYFLPGALAAVISYPPAHAMLAIMFLTMGDAAAGLGTAVGKIKIANTPRKLEGTIGFFLVTLLMSLVVMDGTGGPRTLAVLALSASLAAALCELWAEIIRFDDNLFVPVVGGFALHYLVNLLTPTVEGEKSRILILLGPFLDSLQYKPSV